MESNSDKQLRDKLKGIEFPFDPQAWENMEAMLDKKKKRRGFFWLWTGGIAASLLLVGVLGYEFGVNSNRLQVAADKLNTTETENRQMKSEVPASESGNEISESKRPESVREEMQNETASSNSLNEGASISSATREENVRIAKPASANWNSKLTAAKETDQASENKTRGARQRKRSGESHRSSSTTNSLSANQEEQLSSSGKMQNSFSSHEPSTASSSKNSVKEKRRNSLLQKAKQGGVNTTIQPFEKNVPREESETFASAVSSTSLLQQRIEMDRRAGLLEPTSEESSFNKTKDETLPKSKKKNFQYSLGALANVSATILGDEHRGPDSLKNVCEECYRKPSYSAGITHDFLFGKRVAITNSILYSRTSFEICYPNVPYETIGRTRSYTATINELQIPIGIKVYPVVKDRFRFYIVASVINHIKLTEIFELKKIDYNNVNAFFQPNSFVTTADNPFETSKSKSSTLQNTGQDPVLQAEYFGLGGAKRYYASFYASAGVEYIHKKKYIFFTEPMFYMSLNQIGLQEKRKYNVGVSGGFRYQF